MMVLGEFGKERGDSKGARVVKDADIAERPCLAVPLLSYMSYVHTWVSGNTNCHQE